MYEQDLTYGVTHTQPSKTIIHIAVVVAVLLLTTLVTN